MIDTKQNQRDKESYRAPKDFKEDFYAGHAASGLSMNAFITMCIKHYLHGNHKDKALELKLATIVDNTAHIKAAAERNGLGSDELTRDFSMVRTVCMKLWGQRK